MKANNVPPLPPYQWPTPPNNSDGPVPSEIIELYKAQLSAHVEFIKQQIEEELAPSRHLRELDTIDHQGTVDAATAAAQAEVERLAADRLAFVNQEAADQIAAVAKAATEAASEQAMTTLRLDFLNSSVVEIHKAYIEVAKGSIDRNQKRAELLQAAAVAVGTLYTGLLAFFFIEAGDITDANVALTQALPARGIIPAIFLGLTIVFAMAYLAFRTIPGSGAVIDNEVEPLAYIEQQRNIFVEWVNHVVWWRVALIQLAVICLGLAVSTLPVAFIDISNDQAVGVTVAATLAVLVLWGAGWIIYGISKKRGRT